MRFSRDLTSFLNRRFLLLGIALGASLVSHGVVIFLATLGILQFPEDLPSSKRISSAIHVGMVSLSHSVSPRTLLKSSTFRRTAPLQNTASNTTAPPPDALESEPSTAEASDSGVSAGTALQHYLAQVVQELNRSKHYPAEAVFRSEEGRVVVSLVIQPHGAIEHVHLHEPCPFESLNHAAIDSVLRLGRLPALPGNRLEPLTIQVPLVYVMSSR